MRTSGNNQVVMEFRGYGSGGFSIEIQRVASIARAFCELAELGNLSHGVPKSERDTLVYLKLVGAHQGSLIVYFEPVIRWLNQHREAASHYASILALPIALLALCGVGHSDAPEKSDNEFEAALKRARLRQNDRDIDGAIDVLIRELQRSGSRSVKITVPGAPSIEITVDNDQPEEGEHYQSYWTVETHLARQVATQIRALDPVVEVTTVWTEESDGKTLTQLDVRFDRQTGVKEMHECRSQIVRIIKQVRSKYYA